MKLDQHQKEKNYNKFEVGEKPFVCIRYMIEGCDSLFSGPIQGYMFGILSACLSALAGIYTQFLMKKNDDTLYWQNVQLYT